MTPFLHPSRKRWQEQNKTKKIGKEKKKLKKNGAFLNIDIRRSQCISLEQTCVTGSYKQSICSPEAISVLTHALRRCRTCHYGKRLVLTERFQHLQLIHTDGSLLLEGERHKVKAMVYGRGPSRGESYWASVKVRL